MLYVFWEHNNIKIYNSIVEIKSKKPNDCEVWQMKISKPPIYMKQFCLTLKNNSQKLCKFNNAKET